MHENSHPFHRLTPDFIMDAVESQGFRCDCRTLALNSYENRVYQVGIDDGQPLIAKFYRPGRWSDEQIIEEHDSASNWPNTNCRWWRPGAMLPARASFTTTDFRFALYPRQGGHAPEFDNLDNLLILGRMLGRIHRIGAVRPFVHRPALDSRSFGHAQRGPDPRAVHPGGVPARATRALTEPAAGSDRRDPGRQPVRSAIIRAHGDCHSGNILWRDQRPAFRRFRRCPHGAGGAGYLDDAVRRPPAQDRPSWMH